MYSAKKEILHCSNKNQKILHTVFLYGKFSPKKLHETIKYIQYYLFNKYRTFTKCH